MAYEKDEVWGTAERRTLAYTRPDARTRPLRQDPRYTDDSGYAPTPAEGSSHGPEAVVRAREMDYELTTRIQQESPYIREEVVEHRVHDHRLYVGMWIVAGVNAVAAFLTYSPWHAGAAVVATFFALTSTPGRQYAD